ncbi:MAG: cytochrome b/b6 domain-containing protein [bacterium]
MSRRDFSSSRIERISHWALISSLFILLFTNCGLLFSSLLFIRHLFWSSQNASTIHHVTGMFFSLSLLVSFFIWIKDCIPDGEDLEWLRRGGPFSWVAAPFGRGKFNTIQKLYFFGTMLFGIMAASSGILLWNPYLFKRELIAWGHVFHTFSATFFTASGIIHIYLRHFR